MHKKDIVFLKRRVNRLLWFGLWIIAIPWVFRLLDPSGGVANRLIEVQAKIAGSPFQLAGSVLVVAYIYLANVIDSVPSKKEETDLLD